MVNVEQASRLIGVEAFVEGAGHMLSQQGLELLPGGDGGVAGEGEGACHSITQRTCHGGQVGILRNEHNSLVIIYLLVLPLM